MKSIIKSLIKIANEIETLEDTPPKPRVIKERGKAYPKEWGEKVKGLKTVMDTHSGLSYSDLIAKNMSAPCASCGGSNASLEKLEKDKQSGEWLWSTWICLDCGKRFAVYHMRPGRTTGKDLQTGIDPDSQNQLGDLQSGKPVKIQFKEIKERAETERAYKPRKK